MEQITREEMIELLNVAACPAYCNNGVIVRDELHGEIEQCQFCYEREQAIAALQAAEPVAWIGEEELDGLAMHRRNDFPAGAMVLAIKAGSAKFPLFTLPCPPATALAPESWREELETIAEILEADGDEWNCAARIRKMLTASPAPGHSGDDNEMADALYKLANLILEKGSFRFSDWLWSDVHIPGIRAAAQYLAARSQQQEEPER